MHVEEAARGRELGVIIPIAPATNSNEAVIPARLVGKVGRQAAVAPGAFRLSVVALHVLPRSLDPFQKVSCSGFGRAATFGIQNGCCAAVLDTEHVD